MSRNESIPSAARTAYRLGQASVASMFISVIVGFSVESIGINGLFLTFVIPLALAAILLSVSARRGMESYTSPGYREATKGLWMGLFVLTLVLLFIVVVAVFFSLLLLLGQ